MLSVYAPSLFYIWLQLNFFDIIYFCGPQFFLACLEFMGLNVWMPGGAHVMGWMLGCPLGWAAQHVSSGGNSWVFLSGLSSPIVILIICVCCMESEQCCL